MEVTEQGNIVTSNLELSNDVNSTFIKLIDLVVEVKRPTDELEIVYESDKTSTKAIIYDKSTGEELESHKETLDDSITKESLERSRQMRATSTTVRHLNTTYTVKPAKVLVYAQATVRAGTGFAEITKVDKTWQAPGNSGYYSLTNTKTSCQTTKFPAIKIGLNASGTVSITKDQSTSVGMDYKGLKGLGFSMSASQSMKWVARKPYNTTVQIAVMR